MFYDLTSLVSLDLSHNVLSGPASSSLISSLTSLDKLYINHNAFDRDVDHNAFMKGTPYVV